MKLPDHVIVYPAHGSGSSCGKNLSSETTSTIGEQKATNYALQPMSKEDFIQEVTDGLLPPPSYFFKDVMMNKNGYESIDFVVEKNHIEYIENKCTKMEYQKYFLKVRQAFPVLSD